MKPNDFGRGTIMCDRQLRQGLHHLSIPAAAIVLCRDGARRAADLDSGDRVITRDRGLVAIRATQTARDRIDTVLLSPEALGEQRPCRLTLLDAAQPVLVRNWRAPLLFGKPQATVRADALCDGEYIRALGKRVTDFVVLGFDAPHVIYVNGLELGCRPPLRSLRTAA